MVPEGKNVFLYNLPCFNGKNVQFTESVACLEKVDFNFLQNYGMNLLSEDISLKKSGSMSVKYRKPNLRKSSNLKTYQRN